MKPYYDSKTILSDFDRESEAFASIGDDFVTLGKTLPFEHKTKPPFKATSIDPKIMPALPAKPITPSMILSPIGPSSANPRFPESVKDVHLTVQKPVM